VEKHGRHRESRIRARSAPLRRAERSARATLYSPVMACDSGATKTLREATGAMDAKRAHSSLDNYRAVFHEVLPALPWFDLTRNTKACFGRHCRRAMTS